MKCVHQQIVDYLFTMPDNIKLLLTYQSDPILAGLTINMINRLYILKNETERYNKVRLHNNVFY